MMNYCVSNLNVNVTTSEYLPTLPMHIIFLIQYHTIKNSRSKPLIKKIRNIIGTSLS